MGGQHTNWEDRHLPSPAHLPGSSLAMLAHLLPKMLWAAMMAASSSGVKGPFLTSGLSWLSHLQVSVARSRQSVAISRHSNHPSWSVVLRARF